MRCHHEFIGELVSVGATAPPCQSMGPAWCAGTGNKEARPVTPCHFWSTESIGGPRAFLWILILVFRYSLRIQEIFHAHKPRE